MLVKINNIELELYPESLQETGMYHGEFMMLEVDNMLLVIEFFLKDTNRDTKV